MGWQVLLLRPLWPALLCSIGAMCFYLPLQPALSSSRCHPGRRKSWPSVASRTGRLVNTPRARVGRRDSHAQEAASTGSTGMASDMPQSTSSSSSSFPVVPRDDVDQFDIPMSSTVSIPVNALEGRHQDESVQQNENLHGSGGHDKTLKSQIRHIRSRYLAGMANSALSSAEDSTNGESDNDDDSITISFPDHHNLVAVTGETASGKSLLVARVIELLTGNKGSAASYIAPGHSTATAEIELFLTDPYLAAAEFLFERLDLDSSSLIPTVDNEINRTGTLVLSRTLQLQLQPTNDANGNSGNGANGKARLKSVCSVNGQLVTLKVLASVASPLLAVVDTPMAAAALSKASARTGILDTAVPKQILNRVAEARRHHRECRRQRERLQEELASRTLPSGGADSDSELLSHWINELDAFEVRIANFCRAACAGYSSEENIEDGNALSAIRRRLLEASWCDSEGMSSSLSSNLFTLLTDFRDALQSLDNEIMVVQNAVEALGALSSTNSAATALERARKLLLSVSSSQSTSSSSSSRNSKSDKSKLASAMEQSHDLLNQLEMELRACAKFLRDDDDGVLSILEMTRSNWDVSVESIDALLLDWKSLARKHGILPVLLPSYHMTLIRERDGNDEARAMLPSAMAAEQKALVDLQYACAALTVERTKAADYLADAVSNRMPSLGMGDSVFRVNLTIDELSSVEDGVGVESADFLLLHSSDTTRRGALINEVASSGEKARILLAIECAMPGSIGIACSNVGTAGDEKDAWDGLPPISVVYDEIDAHVGGRAAVSMANLLVDQSRSGQVIAITHSPSVAAAADMHVVIQRGSAFDPKGGGSKSANTSPVSARVVNERDRRLELARMASGDLAAKEAEAFAEALIRDGMERRRTTR